MNIFVDFIEDIMEVFMDNFYVCGSNFENYLDNLEKVLKRCVKVNLVLNWERQLHGEEKHYPRTSGVHNRN